MSISISIFIPLLIFSLVYLKERSVKRSEKKKERKYLIKFLFNLLIELEKNLKEYPSHLKEISEIILTNYSKLISVVFESHTGGIINRLSKIDSKELHIAIIVEIKKTNPIILYQKIYREIDFFDDFYKRLLETIKNYHKSSADIKIEFRKGLYDFMNFHANLLTSLKSNDSYNEYVEYTVNLTENYLSKQSDDLDYHLEYLNLISIYVKKNHRTEFFANEIIERIKKQKIILDDLKGNAMMYSHYYISNSKELIESLDEIRLIITELKENGI